MFDFEKLIIYDKAKPFNSEIRSVIKETPLDRTTKDQLRRASFSIVLNIAEGSGRFSKPDRRNFFVIARSSAFECVAILDVLNDEEIINENKYRKLYNNAEEISKVLFAMIKNLSQRSKSNSECLLEVPGSIFDPLGVRKPRQCRGFFCSPLE